MTLREQILQELSEQNSIAEAAIKKCDDDIRAENFAMSTVTGGALASTARSACEARIQAASSRRNQLIAANAWISDMLSKYR